MCVDGELSSLSLRDLQLCLLRSVLNVELIFIFMSADSHAEEIEDSREMLACGDRAEDDLEVTNFYVNPIAKPIPQGRPQADLQDTITELNMHKVSRNELEVSRTLNLINYISLNGGSVPICFRLLLKLFSPLLS